MFEISLINFMMENKCIFAMCLHQYHLFPILKLDLNLNELEPILIKPLHALIGIVQVHDVFLCFNLIHSET